MSRSMLRFDHVPSTSRVVTDFNLNEELAPGKFFLGSVMDKH